MLQILVNHLWKNSSSTCSALHKEKLVITEQACSVLLVERTAEEILQLPVAKSALEFGFQISSDLVNMNSYHFPIITFHTPLSGGL